MSKPISFGFSKPKTTTNISNPPTSKPSISKPISFPGGPSSRKTLGAGFSKSKSSALRDDSEDEEDGPPQAEALTGFSSSGAILSKPKDVTTERVIENPGNSDWRKRGKNLLPAEVQAAKKGEDVVTVERDEVSKAYGLQFAEKDEDARDKKIDEDTVMGNGTATQAQPAKVMTEDERALAALLDDGMGKPKSTATIEVASNAAWQQRSEAEDFRADVATRPDSATLDEYAAMPVEEFGMAMLRGMGRKRRANGEIIDLNKNSEEEEKKRKERPAQQGLLGIGAKPVKGLEGVELGTWGKSDMRKNAKGEGFFTPVMIEDKRTGERITEEEFERRKKAAKNGGEEDWRDRRDRNLGANARDKERTDEPGHTNGSLGKRGRDDRDREGAHSSRTGRDRHRDRERDDRDYDSSRSRRERSRSRDRRRDDDDRDRDRERRRDRHRQQRNEDDDRHSMNDGRRGEGRHRDRDRDRDRDDRRYRERR